MSYDRDTIAAPATARGQAALAIIRISGPEAVPIVASCFQGADITRSPSHTVHVGYITTGEGATIDQVVVTLFLTPRSVTGEDVVEISCHGGDFASQYILQRLLERGARLAEPGEFTQRAFLNGKIDLTQAEAVADLIHASSTLAHQVSVLHLQGRYSDWLRKLRTELLEMSAFIELELDFSEEDVSFVDTEHLQELLIECKTLLRQLLESYSLGEKIRDGVRIVIGGLPNVGKSTLLNAILGRDRAIVSTVPGTTRDEIEAELEIEGIRFRFVDTAGIRDVTDEIEVEGVRRARQAIDSCDILIYVYDLSIGLSEEDKSNLRTIRNSKTPTPVLLVGNKRDLIQQIEKPSIKDIPFIGLSALKGVQEYAEVEPLLFELGLIISREKNNVEASAVVVNQRHRQHLSKALQAVVAVEKTLKDNLSGETLALDLRVALDELGAITGEITNEDVLEQIFSRFCIGK